VACLLRLPVSRFCDRRSDREIVGDLEPILVFHSGCDFVEPLDVISQRLTDSIVIDSQSETVIGPVIREAIGKQHYARITGDGVGFLWGISDASEQTNSSGRLATPEFLSDRLRVVFHKEILRKVSDRNPTPTLIVDGQSLS
jgi:hypothetical protein